MLKLKVYLLVSLAMISTDMKAEQSCSDHVSQPDERFVTFADKGLVRDRLTGLLWQRCSVGQFWDGEDCEESSKRMIQSWFSWSDFDAAIKRVEKETGQKGWRVPSVDELQTLVNYQCTEPAINSRIFPNTASWRYWSSTPFADNEDYVWVLDFDSGDASTVLKVNASYHIRLVKGKLPLLSIPKSQAVLSPLAEWDDGIHNLSNPSLGAIQSMKEGFTGLKLDDYGQPDWAKMLRQGDINPRVNREGAEELMPVWQHDIIFKDTNAMPWVKFPHGTHSQWLSCENCHDAMFSQKTGTADISMGSIYMGGHCGNCHGKVAFTLTDCARCHSMLHPGVAETWLKSYDHSEN